MAVFTAQVRWDCRPARRWRHIIEVTLLVSRGGAAPVADGVGKLSEVKFVDVLPTSPAPIESSPLSHIADVKVDVAANARGMRRRFRAEARSQGQRRALHPNFVERRSAADRGPEKGAYCDFLATLEQLKSQLDNVKP